MRNDVILGEREPILRAALVQVLEDAGMRVVAGCAAFAELHRSVAVEEADLVLADADLVGDAAGALRTAASAHARPPRLLVFSAAPTVDEVQMLFTAGADGVIARAAEASELVAACRTVLGGRRFVPLDLAGALAERLLGDGRPPWATLTKRELDVMRCAAEGKTVSQIASDLFVSVATAKTHLRSAYGKLGVANRSAAVASLLRAGALV